MVEISTQAVYSEIIDNLSGGNAMRGTVQHMGICPRCKRGDKNIQKHSCNRIYVYLEYLQKPHQYFSKKANGERFKSYLDACVYLNSIQPEITAKLYIPYDYAGKEGSELLFGNYFDKRGKYLGYANYFESIHSLSLPKIDRIVIKNFYTYLPENLKQSTRNLILMILRATLAEAYEHGFITSFPAFPKKGKAEKPHKQFLTVEEQQLVISFVEPKYRLLLNFLATSGKRVSEVLSLKWENIDWKNRAYTIYESKVKTESYEPFHESVFKELPRVIHKKGFVFHQYRIETLNGVLKRACKQAEIKPVTTHEFGRHSFITNRIGLFSNEEIALCTNNLANIGKYEHLKIEKKREIINAV